MGTFASRTDTFNASVSGLNRQLSVLASDNTKLYLMDSGTSFAGAVVNGYVERAGLSFGSSEKMKLVRGIVPRIYGDTGLTVNAYVGTSIDAYGAVTYGPAMPYTIGSSIALDTLVTGRYIAVKFGTGTALAWRLDGYDVLVEMASNW